MSLRSEDSLTLLPKKWRRSSCKDVLWTSFAEGKIASWGKQVRINKQQIVNLNQQLNIQKKLTKIAEKRTKVEHITYER